MEFTEGLRKVFLAGVGAVASTAENAKELIDDLVEKEHHRIRLFISEPIYQLIRQAENNGRLRIVHHEEIVEGCSEPDSPRRRKHKHK